MILTMGNCKSTSLHVVKRGYLYSEIQHRFRPLDIILFHGGDVVADIISTIEKRGNPNAHAGDFTHVGIVINRDILDDPLLQPNRMYIMESTASGKLGNNVYDIRGASHIGVQIRDLESVINGYDSDNETSIAWCPLINNPFVTNAQQTTKRRFAEIYNEVIGITWDANCWSLASAVIPCMRQSRSTIETLFNTKKWLFCSEMVAVIYKHLGIYPNTINARNVVPGDFAYPDEDTDNTPKLINEIVYVTSQVHFSPDYSHDNAIVYPITAEIVSIVTVTNEPTI